MSFFQSAKRRGADFKITKGVKAPVPESAVPRAQDQLPVSTSGADKAGAETAAGADQAKQAGKEGAEKAKQIGQEGAEKAKAGLNQGLDKVRHAREIGWADKSDRNIKTLLFLLSAS